MKINWLIIFILTSILTAFNYTENYGFLSPSVKVSETSQHGFVSFLVNVNSTEELQTLEIKTYSGSQLLKTTVYNLNDSKRAFITYYYFVGNEDTKGSLTFIFEVKDKKNRKKIVKEIFI